ncbi:MAG: transcriptional repressor [Eubacteriales bacterium]|nr:transcriptional repressor [Eubacteriales bacterium]
MEKQKEQIIEKLRANGCRITKQRMELLDIILENRCSSCKEIFYQASRQDENIGIATVYRMVNALEEIGVISRRIVYEADERERA